MHFGEILSIFVAVSWTVTALVAEVASKRLGALSLNVIRMALSILLLALTLWIATGHPYPYMANRDTWFWLSASGLVGYAFGDYCLFNAYIAIGSRYGQLLMTLASPFSALAAWVLMGEQLSWLTLLGMAVTMTGIGMSILGKEGRKEAENSREFSKVFENFEVKTPSLALKLPLRGILLGIGAALGQGIGLVLSKIGLETYAAVAPADMYYMVPFAGTLIRAITGFVVFSVLLLAQGQAHQLATALHDRRGMHCAFWATVTGPFIGVSLSLMAVQYAHVGVAQTLMALTPILILWPSHHFLGTRVTAREVLGAIIAVCGVALFFI